MQVNPQPSAKLTTRRLLRSLVVLTCATAALVGCSNAGPAQHAANPKRPLQKMRSAVAAGNWQVAWRYKDAVLKQHADNQTALTMVARVAQQMQQPDLVAELLTRACESESWQDAGRVRQAMVALAAAGKLHDGIAFLERAVAEQPMQHTTRRWLFDLQIGSENHPAAMPHGQFLLRHREFDAVSLLALSNRQHRTKDLRSLEQMLARNPTDKRPLIRKAYLMFDRKEFANAIELLRDITKSHPNFAPAQELLGRSLSASGLKDEVFVWCKTNKPLDSRPIYWSVAGDWARSQENHRAAARAFWESTKRNPNDLEVWSRLSDALNEANLVSAAVDEESMISIADRIEHLRKADRAMDGFRSTLRISRELAIDAATALESLGRLWEAEAWASVAMTLPEDESIDAKTVRDRIVSKLSHETPWQIIAGHPELSLDLTIAKTPVF